MENIFAHTKVLRTHASEQTSQHLLPTTNGTRTALKCEDLISSESHNVINFISRCLHPISEMTSTRATNEDDNKVEATDAIGMPQTPSHLFQCSKSKSFLFNSAK